MKRALIAVTLVTLVALAGDACVAGETRPSAGSVLKKTDTVAGCVLARLRELRSLIDSVRTSVEKSELPRGEKDKLLERIAETKGAVNTGVGIASSVKGYTGSATQAMDLYGEVKSIQAKARALDLDGSGRLGTSLLALARALKSCGGKVPVIGKALEAYGEATEKLLDALAGLATVIEEHRRQGHVGLGTSSEKPHRNSVLWKQDKAVFEADTYAPCAPPYAFRSVEAAKAWNLLLIWDQPNDTWYIITRRVESEQIYRDHLLLGRALSAKALRDALQSKPYKSHMEARATGERICRYFSALADRDLTWATELAGSDLPYNSVPLFRAKFALDKSFPAGVWALMKLFYVRYNKAGRADLAKRVKDRAISFGCSAARDWKPSDDTAVAGEDVWSAWGTPAIKWKSKETTGTGSAKYYMIFGALVQVRLSANGQITFGKIVPFRQGRHSVYGGKVSSGQFRISFVKVSQRRDDSFSVLTRSEITFNGVVTHAKGKIPVSHKGTKERTFGFGGINGHRGIEAFKGRKLTLGPPASASFTAKNDNDGSLRDAMKIYKKMRSRK